ncbi:MotA/TolQ/ExbB proton channel family protein [Clostridium sp. WILCCON 0269]|uniref:MotA/TolQ/ExbB proton channel family protein n=1 Tax=Candidatus Clostridium eludens TaxID=3381663 RepID=A0ABW8SEB4_9CLOT
MTGMIAFIKGIFSSNVSTTIFFIEVIMFSLDIVFYRIVYRCLKDIDKNIDEKSFHGVEDLIKGYSDMVKESDYINTQSYIEAYFSNYKYMSTNRIFNKLDIPIINIIRIVHMTISAFIVMGVLGTFTGLTISLNSLRTGTFTVDNISPILSGMGVAFYASIVGIVFSLILTFITRIFDTEQLLMNIMAKLENYMDNKIRKYNSRELFQRIEVAVEKLGTSNSETINEFSRVSNETMNKSLDAIERVYEFVQKFSDFPEEFEKSIKYMTSFNKSLKESVDGFDLIFKGFNKLMGTFNKSMNSLDRKFDILDSCVKDINTGQKKVEKSYKDIYDKLDKLTDNFYSSLDDLGHNQKSFLEEMKNFHENMKEKYIDMIREYTNQTDKLGIYINHISENSKFFTIHLDNIQNHQQQIINSFHTMKKYTDEFKIYMKAYNEQKSEIFAQIYRDMKEYQSRHENILNNIVDKMEYFNKDYKK